MKSDNDLISASLDGLRRQRGGASESQLFLFPAKLQSLHSLTSNPDSALFPIQKAGRYPSGFFSVSYQHPVQYVLHGFHRNDFEALHGFIQILPVLFRKKDSFQPCLPGAECFFRYAAYRLHFP